MAYGSDASFTAFLTGMGLSLPVGALPVAALRQIGTMVIDGAYGDRYTGQVVSADQSEEWPRIGATRGSTPLSSETVPLAIEQAAYFTGWYSATNPDAFFGGGNMTQLVKRETVGPLTFEYAISNLSPDQMAAALTTQLPFVDGLLSPYLQDKTSPKISILSIGPC